MLFGDVSWIGFIYTTQPSNNKSYDSDSNVYVNQNYLRISLSLSDKQFIKKQQTTIAKVVV